MMRRQPALHEVPFRKTTTTCHPPISSFVGPHEAAAQICKLLSNSRLVTLSGPGDIGETRLALAVSESLLPDDRDGVWLVELAGLPESAFVTQALASVLGVREVNRPEFLGGSAAWNQAAVHVKGVGPKTYSAIVARLGRDEAEPQPNLF